MSEAQPCILPELVEATGGVREIATMKFLCFLLLVPVLLAASSKGKTQNKVCYRVIQRKAESRESQASSKSLFERIAFQLRNPIAKMDCIPTCNLFYMGLQILSAILLQSSLCALVDPVREVGGGGIGPCPIPKARPEMCHSFSSSVKSRIASPSDRQLLQ